MTNEIVQAMWDQYPKVMGKASKDAEEKRKASDELQAQVAASLREGQTRQTMLRTAAEGRAARKAQKATVPSFVNAQGEEVVVEHPNKFTTVYIVRRHPSYDQAEGSAEEASSDSEPVQADSTAKRSKKR